MYLYSRILFIYLLVGGITEPLYAVVVGSNTVPSRQAGVTFPAVDGDNEMRGFAVFENGVTLATSGTSCIFNSYFPVSGTITLNNGTLNLSRNLVLQNPCTFDSLGTINGNSYRMDFQSTATNVMLPTQTNPFVVNNLEIVLNSDMVLRSPLQFRGSCTVTGNGYTLDTTAGTLVVANGASVLFRDVTLKNLSASRMYCTDSLGTVSLLNVTILQDASYSFTFGQLAIVGDVSMRGAQQFTYATNQVCTIASKATWYFDAGTTLRYAPSTSSQTLLRFADSLATLHLYEATLWSSNVGLRLTKGRFMVEGRCPVKNDGTSTAQAIIFGDGVSSAHDFTITSLDESGLDVQTGYVVNQNMGG
jgi:hypothetical protein